MEPDRMDNEPAVRWLQSIVAEELRDRDPALAMSADYAKSRAKAATPAVATRSASEEISRRRWSTSTFVSESQP
jgi:hypothetical protein